MSEQLYDQFRRLSPKVTGGPIRMRSDTFRDSAVPAKYKILSALAIVVARKCEPCINTRDDKQMQTVGHHWPLSGPLPKEMRDKIEKVGVCITCHQHIPAGSFTGVHKKSFHDQLI